MKFKKIITLFIAAAILSMCLALTACETYEPFSDEYFADMRTDDPSLADGADIRVMSANVLVQMQSWGGKPVAPRAQMFAEALKHYAPDVVGMQEASAHWHSKLMPQIDNYAMIHPRYNFFNENRSPMIYNTDTLELVDEGFHIYSKKQNNYCRVVTWGVFKKKSDGKKFAVTTTHWDTPGDSRESGERIPNMLVQLDELAGIVNEIYNKHNVPVFVTGDFNAEETYPLADDRVSLYSKFIAGAGVSDAEKMNVSYRISSGADKLKDMPVDHIFIKGSAQPLSFTVLTHSFFDIYAEVFMSDHYPIYTDIKI